MSDFRVGSEIYPEDLRELEVLTHKAPKKKMPRKFRRKNYARRVKRYGRTRRFRRRSGKAVISRNRLPCVPDMLFSKFKATDSLHFFRGNVGQLQCTWAYRPNTLNNWIGTDNTGSFSTWQTNPQPGITEFALMYRRYRVVGFSYNIQFVSATTTPHIFTVYPCPRLPTGVYYLPDRPRARTQVSGTASSRPVRFKGYNSVAQLIGNKTVTLSQGGYEANMGADPTEFIYLVCQVESGTSTNQVAIECTMMVRITRYVQLYDRFDLED